MKVWIGMYLEQWNALNVVFFSKSDSNIGIFPNYTQNFIHFQVQSEINYGKENF